MGKIKAIISDFDGTLVHTLEANFLAYHEVLTAHGIALTKENYTSLFGLNVKDLIKSLNSGITNDEIEKIKHDKALCYPKYFDKIKLNHQLAGFLTSLKDTEIRLALATTASKNNVKAILDYFSLNTLFEIAVYGEDVDQGKPAPDCYVKCMDRLNVQPDNVLILEDSTVGEQSAIRSKANYIMVRDNF